MKTDVFHPERRKELESFAAESRAEHQRRVADAKTAIGDVVVSSNPEQAAVWMLLGRTPCDSLPLPAARHAELRIEHEGFQAKDVLITPDHWLGSEDRLRSKVSVTLKSASRRYLAPASPPKPPPIAGESKKGHGIAHIESDPAGAQAWLLVGFTPDVRISSLETGREHELKLTLDGHVPGHVVIRDKDWRNATGQKGREASVFLPLRPRAKRKRNP